MIGPQSAMESTDAPKQDRSAIIAARECIIRKEENTPTARLIDHTHIYRELKKRKDAVNISPPRGLDKQTSNPSPEADLVFTKNQH